MYETRIGLACLAVLTAASAAACSDRFDYVPGESGGPSGGTLSLPSEDDAGGDAGIAGDGAPSAQPVRVQVDPNKIMNATPGQGVGVFTEYDTGGHWYVWWTCDTLVSNVSCAFDVKVTADSGTLSNAISAGFASSDKLTTANAGPLTAVTTTSTTVQGVHFDTAPGAVITLSVALGGAYSGSFLFFVQDGEINGGYKGTLTDPLEFQPSAP